MLSIQNFIKGPLTSVIGLVIIIMSAYASTYTERIDWIWEGLTGCGVGSILIFTPDSIKDIISAVVRRKTE